MSKKTIVLLVLFIMVPVLLYFLWPTDAARIRKLIRNGAAAVEQEDLEKVMACVAFHYQDEYGMSYVLIKEMFKKVFVKYSGISIERNNLVIEVKDATATARLDVRVVGTEGEHTQYIAGDFDEPLRITFTLEKGRISWLIVKTEGLPKYYF